MTYGSNQAVWMGPLELDSGEGHAVGRRQCEGSVRVRGRSRAGFICVLVDGLIALV